MSVSEPLDEARVPRSTCRQNHVQKVIGQLIEREQLKKIATRKDEKLDGTQEKEPISYFIYHFFQRV